MNTALVIVDIQKDYFPGGANELWQAEEAAVAAGQALALFRDNGWPIVHVQHINTREGATFFLPGTPGSTIHPLVEPAANEPVIVKHFPDSFLHTGLGDTLKGLGVERLVVCGMMSHMCIDTTVRSARARNYQVIVPPDACTTRDLAWQGAVIPAGTVHAAFMAALDGAFADLVETAGLSAALGGRCGT